MPEESCVLPECNGRGLFWRHGTGIRKNARRGQRLHGGALADELGLPDADTVRRWADRRAGVGFDQLLLLRAAQEADLAAFYHVFNADGAEVQQCGNGVRCIARYLAPDGSRESLLLASRAGTVEARFESGGDVSVSLGEPDFAPPALPFLSPAAVRARSADGVPGATRYRLETDAGAVEFGAVSMGNPHIVVPVDSLEAAPVGIIGPQLQSHPSFPEGVNVGFVEIRDSASVRLRVFERGAGETAACGTGAAAAAAVGRLWGELGEAVRVEVTGGVLHTDWSGPGHAIWLSGPAVRVFEGRIAV